MSTNEHVHVAAHATQRRQWHVVPIERRGVKLTALDRWIDGKFGLSDRSGIVAWFENKQDAQIACQALNAASATPRTEPAEEREAVAEIVGWNNDATPRLRINTKLHNLPAGTKLYTIPPADDGARVTDGAGGV